jgi:cob(I)alamin adenosyltransferase
VPASIATRKGDDGTTGLLFGQRVPKDHPQIEAVGAFDELNAAIGSAKANCGDLPARIAELEAIQRDLVTLMGEIVCAEGDVERYLKSSFTKLTDADLARIDAGVAALEAANLRFDGWATPGKNPRAAALDVARTVARRAERRLVGLSSQGRQVRPLCLRYINRVADLLWLMARDAEK